jgi:hypothetical protein
MNCELTGFPLADVLFVIALEARTGELFLESGNNIGSVIFHKGAILQAYSPYSRAIGDLLVEGGIISETELLDGLRQQKKNHFSPIGDLFVKTGKVTFEQIEMMVQQQIRQAIREFLAWPELRLSFADVEIKPFDRIHLPVHEFLRPEIMKAVSQLCSPTPDLSMPSAPSGSAAL